MLEGARIALGLLTMIPVRARTETEGISAAAGWFPLVGALVGAAAGAVRLVAQPSVGPAVASALAVLVLVGLTGALHQDGLADLADALGVRGGREQRLAVMREPTVGTFGVLALLLWALLLVTVLTALRRAHAVQTLVIACALARWAAVLHAAALQPARPGGLGAAFSPSRSAVLIATGCGAATVALGPLQALAGLLVAAVTAVAIGTLSWRLLGGRTGDTLGATVALTEVVVCTVLLASGS